MNNVYARNTIDKVGTTDPNDTETVRLSRIGGEVPQGTAAKAAAERLANEADKAVVAAKAAVDDAEAEAKVRRKVANETKTDEEVATAVEKNTKDKAAAEKDAKDKATADRVDAVHAAPPAATVAPPSPAPAPAPAKDEFPK